MDLPAARLHSLDALRGLDMLIILGIDSLVYALYPLYSSSEAWQMLRHQMGHTAWDGLRVYDCVFPLFVYMAGIAMFFSLSRRLESSPWCILRKIWWRALVLVVLGFMVNGPITWDLSNMRFASVLGLIGISGALAGSLILLTGGSMLTNLLMASLLLIAVGVGQYVGGDLTPGGCFNARVDALLCPGKLYGGSFDPEGPLCIISATALNLLGYSTGRLFMMQPNRLLRVLILICSGILVLAAGWSLPIIKGIWTPGFVLCTAGIGAICVAIFHLLVDICGLMRCSLPLRIVGMNALAAYVVTHLVSFHQLAGRILGGSWSLVFTPAWVHVMNAATALLFGWLFCYFLYRKRVFIKL